MSDQHYRVVISADGKQLRGEFRSLVPTIQSANRGLDNTDRRARNAGQSLAYVQQQSQETTQSFIRLGQYATAVFAGFQFANLAQSALETTARLQDLETRMRSLSGSEVQLAANQQYLIELGERHNKTITGLSDAYVDLLALEQNNVLTQEESRTILEGMSNAASALGTSNQQLSDSFYGLAQGLSSPVVAMEEIKQITDPLPGLLLKVEKAAGLAGGGLRDMAKDGAITSDFLKQNLIKALQQYDGAAARTADDISARTRNLRREYELFVSSLEKPISGLAGSSMNALASSMVFLRENSELTTAAIVLLGARGTAGLANLTAARIKNAAATRASAKEDAQAAIRAKELAAADLAAAQASLKKAQASNVLASGAVAKADRITEAQARLTNAQNSYASATQRATIATQSLSAKTRLLRGAGALIGGPAGVFTLAAVAIATFAQNARAGAPDVAALKQEVDLLLGNQQAVKRNRLNEGLQKAKKAVVELEQALERLNNRRGRNRNSSTEQSIDRTQQELASARKQVERLQAELNKKPELSLASLPATGAGNERVNQISKEEQKLKERGQRQLAQLQFDLLSEEEQIKTSYQRRKEIILNNTQEGSEQRQTLLQQNSQRYIEQLRQVYETEKQMEDDKNRAVIASYERAAQQRRQSLMDSANAMGQIFGNISQVLMEGNKKQFEQGKKFAQAQAIVSGSLAAVKALTAGPILGPILAGTIAALTAVQVAKINQQQYQPPAAHGGLDYIPEERTYTLQKGERVVSPRQNQDLMGYINKQSTGGGVGKQNLVQNFTFQSFNPAEAAQILRNTRGSMGSRAMKQAS